MLVTSLRQVHKKLNYAILSVRLKIVTGANVIAVKTKATTCCTQ